MRIGSMCLLILLQTCTLLAAEQTKQEREPRQQPRKEIRVLVDWSTHNVYGTRDIRDRYLAPAGHRLWWTFNWPSKSGLEQFDVLIVDTFLIFRYPAREIAAIKKYVASGGGLLLAGHGKRYTQDLKSLGATWRYPLNDVAEPFGCRFTEYLAAPPLRYTTAPPFKVGNVWETDPNIGPRDRVPCLLDLDRKFRVVLHDSRNLPVVAVRFFGKGRVAAIGENWFFSSPDAKLSPKLANQEFILNLLEWLAAERVGKGTPSNDPEIRAPVVIDDGVFKVHAVDSLLPLARGMYKHAHQVYENIASQFGYRTSKVYHLFPLPEYPGGGGASGRDDGYIVGAGAMCLKPVDEAAMTRVLAHEIAHTFVRARLSGIEESFASLVADRALISLHLDAGLERDPLKPMRIGDWPRLAYEKDDPRGDRIDLSEPVPPELSAAAFGKGMSVVETLEDRYGQDFMTRYFQLLEKEDVQRSLSMKEVVQYMSRIAGEDLEPWFRSIGTWRSGHQD